MRSNIFEPAPRERHLDGGSVVRHARERRFEGERVVMMTERCFELMKVRYFASVHHEADDDEDDDDDGVDDVEKLNPCPVFVKFRRHQTRDQHSSLGW